MQVCSYWMGMARAGKWPGKELHRAVNRSTAEFLIGVAAMALILIVLSVVDSHAAVTRDDRIAAILYAEAANDRAGWSAKLNTYNQARRKGESLERCMQRVSSAYRTKSRQYVKASTGELNRTEKRVYANILKTVKAFQPDPDWKYIKHENLKLYKSRKAAMRHLRRVWGKSVNYASARKIGKEHYFCKS